MILITRPLKDSKRVAKILEKNNMSYFIEPMLEIVSLNIDFKTLEQFDVLIITSSNALDSIANYYNKEIEIITFDYYCSKLAKEYNFYNITEVSKGVDNIINYLKNNMSLYKDKSLCYLRGENVYKDLLSILNCNNIVELIVYKAIAVNNISNELIKLIKNYSITHIMFYSRRSANIFEKLVVESNIIISLKSIIAVCFSDNITKTLNKENWKKVIVCNNLLELI